MHDHEPNSDRRSAPTFDVTTSTSGTKVAMLSEPDNGQAWITINQDDLVPVEP